MKSSRAEHQQLPIAKRRSGQRGVAALWTIVSLPVLLTLLLVVIEAAHLFLARVELQSGLEAAALAGVKTWADISEATTPPNEHVTPGLLVITSAARLAAQSTAANNTVSGQPIVLGLNELDDLNDISGYDNQSCGGDILLGSFPSIGTTFTTTASVGCGRTMAGGSVPNEDFAVLTQKTMNVDPLFKRLLGLPPIGAIPITGRAIAVARCRAIDDMDPIVLNPRAVYYTTIVCP